LLESQQGFENISSPKPPVPRNTLGQTSEEEFGDPPEYEGQEKPEQFENVHDRFEYSFANSLQEL
jgi:hypothetical protein